MHGKKNGPWIRRGARNMIGAIGELHAEQYLKKSGMVILERNWRCRRGEIDIVARDGRTLVIVEVKTRILCAETRLSPLDALTWQKQQRLRRLVELYLLRKCQGKTRPPVRIDVVAVILRKGDNSLEAIDHFLAAI
ncbi:MAG: YraN family protein [Bdellovibrionales bacterium]|nr:YraN family protein [Bdellovibrionales bacterium]